MGKADQQELEQIDKQTYFFSNRKKKINKERQIIKNDETEQHNLIKQRTQISLSISRCWL